MEADKDQIVANLFRQEYGRLVAVVTRYFGTSEIDRAEDIVQDTLISALDHWSTGKIPKEPVAWLFTVAKRKAINELKRNSMKHTHHEAVDYLKNLEHTPSEVYLDNEIQDSQLRMIFTCCHPALDASSQIALTLKTLCGLGVKEISKALLNNEEAIRKKLYRSKQKLKASGTEFVIPTGKELESRLDAVSLAMYLLFNEGYNSSSGDTVIQKDLCLEAIRLTQLLTEAFPNRGSLSALLALMCFHVARFEARVDDHGAIILFEDQDRSRWNRELIQIGMKHFQESFNKGGLSAYHLEARIAAEHCMAKSFDETNWKVIEEQYSLLYNLKPNPVIQLNLAIIKSKTSVVRASLSQLESLKEESSMRNYHLLYATLGVFYMDLGDYSQALLNLEKALSTLGSRRERAFILNKISECKEKSQRL